MIMQVGAWLITALMASAKLFAAASLSWLVVFAPVLVVTGIQFAVFLLLLICVILAVGTGSNISVSKKIG